MINKSGWYVLYTRSRHEKKISSMLDQKKITSFLPLNKVVKQWTDRKKIIEEPFLSLSNRPTPIINVSNVVDRFLL